jgi:signal transduction histidine kinase
LNRALTNLVANAIRHTGAGGTVDVTVRAVLEDEDTAAAVVRVRDECGGIPDSDVARLFDVGFRGEPARTPLSEPVSRAGLGLAITRGIVEAHRGSVDVHNVPGGCEFTVRLPVAA